MFNGKWEIHYKTLFEYLNINILCFFWFCEIT